MSVLPKPSVGAGRPNYYARPTGRNSTWKDGRFFVSKVGSGCSQSPSRSLLGRSSDLCPRQLALGDPEPADLKHKQIESHSRVLCADNVASELAYLQHLLRIIKSVHFEGRSPDQSRGEKEKSRRTIAGELGGTEDKFAQIQCVYSGEGRSRPAGPRAQPPSHQPGPIQRPSRSVLKTFGQDRHGCSFDS